MSVTGAPLHRPLGAARPASHPADRPLPVSRRGPHWQVRSVLERCAGAWLVLAVVAAGAGDGRVLLAAPLLVLAVVAGAARRRDWVIGDWLYVRRLRTHRLHLPSVLDAHLRSVPLRGHRASVVELVMVGPDGGEVAVPIWRTRSPRGVDAWACDCLADQLTAAPLEVLALLRAQGHSVRTGSRPTPLDRLVTGYPLGRRSDWPSTRTPPPRTSVTASRRPGAAA